MCWLIRAEIYSLCKKALVVVVVVVVVGQVPQLNLTLRVLAYTRRKKSLCKKALVVGQVPQLNLTSYGVGMRETNLFLYKR